MISQDLFYANFHNNQFKLAKFLAIIKFYIQVDVILFPLLQINQKMIDLGASIISSTISTILLYPAQRIKIEMQLTKRQEQLQIQIVDELGLTQGRSFKKQKLKLTIKNAIRSIHQKHGLKGFYSGLESLVIGNCLSYGVYFVCYEKCKDLFAVNQNHFSTLTTMKSSAIAGSVASIVTNPFWVLQTKQTQQEGSLFDKAKQLIQSQGFMSLWKGLSTSLILVSNPIIQFAIYEKLKSLIKMNNSNIWYDLVIFLIGAISKTISTLITYPQTVIRTHQHMQKGKKKWHNIMMAIIKTEGLSGLYKGIQPKLIQTVLNSALLLMLFQKIRIILGKLLIKK